MFDPFLLRSAKKLALFLVSLIQIAGCSSPENRAQNYYEHGKELFLQHENKKAAIEFRNAVKLKADLSGAWRSLAQIDELDRNWSGVIADLRRVVELEPNDVNARLKLGKLRLVAGSLDEALSVVNRGIELDTRNADLRALKAAIFFKLGDHVGAVREAQTALEFGGAKSNALMVLAAVRLAERDINGALSVLDETSVADEKDQLDIQLFKLKIFEQTGELKSAESVLRKLLELYPQDAVFRKLLINSYVAQHHFDDAEKEMRAWAAANPTDSSRQLEVVRFLYTVRSNPAAARRELIERINVVGDVFPYQLALADMDLSEGNLSDGKQMLEGLVSGERSPEHVLAAQLALAQVYLRAQNPEAAQMLVSEILRKDPRNSAGLKLRASIQLGRGQLDAAIAGLRQALGSQPGAAELMLALALAYERSGSIELAEKEFADATRASNFEVNVGLAYVAFLQRRKGTQRAEDILTELSNRWPDNIQVLSALAQVRLARKNWVGAQEIAESIRRIGYDGGIADQILGMALFGRHKYDESVAAFQNAYKSALDAVEPMEAVVRGLLRANQKYQAIAFLQSVIDTNPGNANALVLLGSIQLEDRATDQALKNFTTAVKTQPRNAAGYRALAEYYVSQKNHEAAIKVIRAGIQDQPDMFALHLILAGLLEQMGDYEGAISQYESMLDKQSSNMIVVNNLASLLSDHRADKASLDRAQLLAASLRKSQIPQFKDTFGWVAYRQGDYRTAVPMLEDAAAEIPDQASVRYHLGMGYISMGELLKASEQLKKALELAPTGELADQIRAALKKTGS
jgi:tetratricopeptide (TPR) repeat protein